MTDLAARVAATTLRTTTHTEGRAVGLDVSKTLAMVALLGYTGSVLLFIHLFGQTLTLSGARVRAVVALMTRLFAVVAQTFTAGADLGVVANIAAFVAGTARKGRHLCQVYDLFIKVSSGLPRGDSSNRVVICSI